MFELGLVLTISSWIFLWARTSSCSNNNGGTNWQIFNVEVLFKLNYLIKIILGYKRLSLPGLGKGPGFSGPSRTGPGFWVFGPVSDLKVKSGPGSGLKIEIFSGSKISGPGRPARCRALISADLLKFVYHRSPYNF